MIQNRDALRWKAWVAAAATLLSVGCTAAAPPPVTRPGAGISAELIPPAPVDAPSELMGAWTALRISGAIPAAAAIAADVRATALGQTYEGYRALRTGDAGAAQSAFGAALGVQQDLAEAAYGMGLVAQYQGRPDLAAEWFRDAIRIDPGMTRAAVELNRQALDSVAPLLRRAEQAAAADDIDGALATYREVLMAAPFLPGPHIRMAELHRAAGDLPGAMQVLEAARRGLGEHPAVLRRLGDLYTEARRYAEATDAYERLADALPGDTEAAALARGSRESFERAALPSEYRTLAAQATMTREELAAVIAINLEPLGGMTGGRSGVIVADVGDRWTTPYILRTVEWGVLDVYQNNEFYPRMEVLRSMLVEAAYRVLEIVGAAEGAPRPALVEPPPEHVLYSQVQAIVGLGIMTPARNGVFDLLDPVTGAEAMAAVDALAAIVRQYGS